jgi:hypothetical protein
VASSSRMSDPPCGNVTVDRCPCPVSAGRYRRDSSS